MRNVNDACTIAVGEKLWCGVAMGINHMAEGLKDIMDDYIVQNAKKKLQSQYGLRSELCFSNLMWKYKKKRKNGDGDGEDEESENGIVGDHLLSWSIFAHFRFTGQSNTRKILVACKAMLSYVWPAMCVCVRVLLSSAISYLPIRLSILFWMGANFILFTLLSLSLSVRHFFWFQRALQHHVLHTVRLCLLVYMLRLNRIWHNQVLLLLLSKTKRRESERKKRQKKPLHSTIPASMPIVDMSFCLCCCCRVVVLVEAYIYCESHVNVIFLLAIGGRFSLLYYSVWRVFLGRFHQSF